MNTVKQLEKKALEIAEHARKVQAINDELCAMLDDLVKGGKIFFDKDYEPVKALLAKARGVK